MVGRANETIDKVERYMADEPRDVDAELHGTARAFVRYQPKGVIGNIVPWNFPFDLGFGPVVDMLAAGNRVMLRSRSMRPRAVR